MSEKKKDETNAFDALRDICVSCEDEIAKLIPQYLQSISNLNTAYINTCKKMTESSIAITKELSDLTGTAGKFPSSMIKNASDTAETFTKVMALYNKVILAFIDAQKEGVETFNDNIDTFTKLNVNMLKTWQSLPIPPRS